MCNECHIFDTHGYKDKLIFTDVLHSITYSTVTIISYMLLSSALILIISAYLSSSSPTHILAAQSIPHTNNFM